MLKIGSSVWLHPVCITTSVINCVSLKELHLECVRVSEEALHDILSSCTLLEKIELLHSCTGFKTIKVKNLDRLYQLTISEEDDGYAYGPESNVLEISHVPNLGIFNCNLPFQFNTRSISLGSNLTELTLAGYGMVTDNACLEMIGSRFPFLESLTLDNMNSWMPEGFHFTCASIKRLSLKSCPLMLTDVQVDAPNLLFFSFDGAQLPGLLFPVSTLGEMIVSLTLRNPVDVDFFLKLREVLTLSTDCDIHITAACKSMVPLDINDLRTRLVLPPATNVQTLWFGTIKDECLWERSPFFDAFYEICHPKYVFAQPDRRLSRNNHFCRVMLREVLEKKASAAPYWAHYLKRVRIRQIFNKNWEDLTESHRSFLDGSASGVYLCFYLKWG